MWLAIKLLEHLCNRLPNFAKTFELFEHLMNLFHRCFGNPKYFVILERLENIFGFCDVSLSHKESKENEHIRQTHYWQIANPFDLFEEDICAWLLNQ